MAEQALTYFTTLALVFNMSVIAGLTAIVVLAPRMTRRRPAHRAERAPLRRRLAIGSGPARPAGTATPHPA